jgi:hypothetical protein
MWTTTTTFEDYPFTYKETNREDYFGKHYVKGFSKENLTLEARAYLEGENKQKDPTTDYIHYNLHSRWESILPDKLKESRIVKKFISSKSTTFKLIVCCIVLYITAFLFVSFLEYI